MINWDEEAIMFLLLFYAMSNNSTFPETQPECCWNNTWNNIKKASKEELDNYFVERTKASLNYNPEYYEKDYFSGVGGDIYE